MTCPLRGRAIVDVKEIEGHRVQLSGDNLMENIPSQRQDSTVRDYMVFVFTYHIFWGYIRRDIRERR